VKFLDCSGCPGDLLQYDSKKAVRIKDMKFLTPNLTSRLITTTFLLPKMSRQYNRGSDRPRKNNRNDSPTVALSKQLSWLLRHHLDESGLEVRTDGYVRLDELVRLHTMCKSNHIVNSSQVSSIHFSSDP
jgi:hypothetical protein